MPGAAQAVANPVNAVMGKVLDPTITSLPGTKHGATQGLAMLAAGVLPTLLYNATHGGGGDNSNPSTIPNLGINPTFYNPNSFAPRPQGSGINGDVNRLAGPAYIPRPMDPTGNMPAAPSGAPSLPGVTQPSMNIAQLIAMMKHRNNMGVRT